MGRPDSSFHTVGVKVSDEEFRMEMDTAMASLDSLLEPVDPMSIFPGLTSMGMVTMPKGYVFLLIGFLVVGALMIFVADSVRSRKANKRAVVAKRRKKRKVIQDHRMQSVFESFVVTLFDPLFFKYRSVRRQSVLTSDFSEEETGPDLEFEFRHKDTHARFIIRCQYCKNTGREDFPPFAPAHPQSLKNFQIENGVPVYYVLGFGGAPDDPRELFLVPESAITRDAISKEALKPFSKSGMFFYNRTSGRLQ